MKNQVKWIAIVVVMALLMVGSYFLYNNLADKFNDEQIKTEDTDNTAEKKSVDFTVFDEKGNEVKLSDFKGKPVVVNFWATWCGYCVKEMPHFDEAYKKNLNVQFLMVNATGNGETVEKASKFVADKGYEFPVVYDTQSNAIRSFAGLGFPVGGLPITFFIDEDGNVVTFANGMIDAETLQKGIDMIKKKS